MDAFSSVHEIRSTRLERDEQRLAELESQISLVSRCLDDMTAKIHELERSRTEAQAWLGALVPQRDDVQRSMKAQRAALSPLAFFPEELLGHIFRMAAFEPDPFWLTADEGTANYHRAHAPFVFAAVSQHWRSAALHAPDIWHYIAVPPIGEDSEEDHEKDCHILDYVELVLSRSGATALDIMLESIDDPAYPPLVQSIVEALSRHIGRWRRLYVGFNFYSAEDIFDTMQFLRGDAWLLEELALAAPMESRGGDEESDQPIPWPTDLPLYLFHCPELRVCSARGVPFAWDKSHVPVASLVSLCLELDTMPLEALWTTLEISPLLESLTISIEIKEDEDLPPRSIELKRLKTLRLLGNSPSLLERRSAAFKTPTLQRLSIQSNKEHQFALPALAEFFSHCAGSLEELDLLKMDLEAESIETLRPLKGVRALRFTGSTLPRALFDAMHDEDDCLLARVSELVFSECSDEEPCGALLRLVRARNTAGGPGDADTALWSRLQRVEIDEGCDFPKWDVIEIQGIMRGSS